MPAIQQAAILCGGLGTRLGALTAATPKPLLPVGERPFLDILLEALGQAGVRRMLLLAGFMAERIADYAAATPIKPRFGLSIEVAAEPYAAGTGGALWHTRDRLDEAFYLLNGDSWFDIPVPSLGERLLGDPRQSAWWRCARSPMRRVMAASGWRGTGSPNSPSGRHSPGPVRSAAASMRSGDRCSIICASAARWSAMCCRCSPARGSCAASPSMATLSISACRRIWRAPGGSSVTKIATARAAPHAESVANAAEIESRRVYCEGTGCDGPSRLDRSVGPLADHLAAIPDRPDGFVGMAGVLVELGRIGEAEDLLDKTMERFPSDLWSAVLYAEIPRRTRNSREGLRRWEMVHKNFPDTAVSHVGIGSALRDIGEFDTAETAFAKATKRFPTDLWAAHNYAEIAGRRGDWAEALRRWERVRQGFPEHASAYVGAADALLKLERYEEADQLPATPPTRSRWIIGALSATRVSPRVSTAGMKQFRRWDVALQRFPSDAAAHIGKAEALVQAGHFSEAENFLKDSIERFPEETRLTRLGSEISNLRRAAGRTNTSEERGAILDELARIRAIAGEDQSLLIRAIYAEVLSLAPPPPEITEQLNRHFAALSELIPHKSTECAQFCERLELSDIECVCLLSVGLKHARENAVWLHYALAAALNNLLLSGQILARAPCLLHSFLAIVNSAGGRDNEPLAAIDIGA